MREVLAPLELGFTHFYGFDEVCFLLQQPQSSIFHQLLGVNTSTGSYS